jgi:hypothetical protein
MNIQGYLFGVVKISKNMYNGNAFFAIEPGKNLRIAF